MIRMTLRTKNINGIAGMPKRKRNCATSVNSPPESNQSLRNALSKRTKAELVEIVLELAKADRKVLRQLTAQFDVALAPDELVAATRQAIIDATAFDKREINHNFAYDYAAYDAVKRNLSILMSTGRSRQAMELSLELMKLSGRDER
jgi:hypothetical protein